MKACADRLDFAGAAQYKLKLDAAILDKAESVKNAYKKMTAAEQESAFQRVFGEFIKNPPAPKMNVTQHSDHYEPESWIEFLNSLKGAWFAPFTPGSFSVLWPTSLPETKQVKAVTPTKLDPAHAPAIAAAPAPAPVLNPSDYTAPAPPTYTTPAPAPAPLPPLPPLVPKAPSMPPADTAIGIRPSGLPQSTLEFKQIIQMGLDGVADLAFKLGINPNGKGIRKLAHMVYDAKYPKL